MGMSLNIAFNKMVPPFDTLGGDHPALGDHIEKLDKVAEKRGLPKLMPFWSTDPDELAEDLGLDGEDLGLPPLEWFSPADGLAAVRAVAEMLRQEPKAIAGSAALLSDLESVEQELVAAQKRKAKFHFCLLD